MRAAAILLCVLLAGCGSTVRVQRVEIPVPVPCIDQARVPVAPDDKFAKSATLGMDEQVRALLLDREASRVYSGRLRALVTSCVIP